MKLLPFNGKAREVCDANQFGYLTVLEGSVRSMKTVASLIAWLLYVVRSDEKVFLMSGYTAGSLLHNCITEEYGLQNICGGMLTFRADENGRKYMSLGGKHIYYCGAGTADAQSVITGLSIGGWYADEVNKHHKTFVNQALNRSIASQDRCNFWTLNPEAPSHWIYKDYIDKYKEQNLSGYRWYHFTLDDNPAISAERKAELRQQYTGVFFQRDILGLRVRAEGACFPSFVHNAKGKEGSVMYELPEHFKPLFANIGADIGGTGSATTNACTVFYRNDKGELCGLLIDEMYDTDNKSTESIIANFKQFVIRNKKRFNVAGARSDSAEQLIKKSYQATGVCNVADSLKRPIVDRIRFFDLAYSLKRFYIWHECVHTIEAVESAVWSDKPSKDGTETRLDDGSTNIDSLDALEYSVEEYMSDFNLVKMEAGE